MSSTLMLVLAATLLLGAHVIRAMRWSLLFPRNRGEPDQRGLLIGLGTGYAINAIVPLRIGELVRAAVASRMRRSRFAECLATIVAERVWDLALVSAFVIVGWAVSSQERLPVAALAYAGSVGVLAASALLLRHSAKLRQLMWVTAGLFNPRIRLAVADFVWSTAEILVGGTLLRWQFSIATLAMWGTYFAAYQCFARAIGVTLDQVIQGLLLQPLSSFSLTPGPAALPAAGLQLFVLSPVAAILVIELGLRLWKRAPGTKPAFPQPESHFAASTRYSSASGYDDFLDAVFSDARAAVSGFGRRAVADCVVHHFYRGGSDALTALVETPDRLLIRKFGLGSAATKLRQQAEWLQRHSDAAMPLVPVLGANSAPGAYSYDMPLVERSSEFHEAIHSRPVRDSSKTLLRLFQRLDELHSTSAVEQAPGAAIEAYVHEKICRNANAAVRFARSAIGSEEYSINGVPYRLDEWRVLQDRFWLDAQIRNRGHADIHGDLTIENVVIAPEERDGFYVIDPNPGNLFDSPLIDWAKMMQSLHLGYEGLNKTATAEAVAGAITLPIARSEAYAELHRLLESEIVSRFSDDALREVYFHELVNYLRLTPYKIRQSRERGLAFFACTSMLLRKYQQAFA